MRLIIHDLDQEYNKMITKVFRLDKNESKIIFNNGDIKHCVGCFNCWVKTPRECR